ncbi:MAG: class I SAM-dependent methyltransferase [Candidatus Heimdallarchaeota archaeon]|nr:class I SAM-dependent methyltransferase [Candidatus Heimdallarchaeota archaeon]
MPTPEENIEFVKEGYKHAAKLYREDKDPNQADIPVFKEWLSKVNSVIELGCASGFPIAERIIESGISYTGIDLSPEQISMAKSAYPQWAENFIEAEMLSFLSTCEDNSVDGIVSMFSIRHLPRNLHASLFSECSRVLKPDGFLLIDHTEGIGDDRDSWFNGLPMYWSGFSLEWQKITLRDLGFVEQNCCEDVKVFLGVEEKTLFCYYQNKKLLLRR